jgi:RNA polymerase primary sigma factor
MNHHSPVPYDYQHSNDFHTLPLSVIDAPMPNYDTWHDQKQTMKVPAGAHLLLVDAYLWPLLSGEQERHLFRQLNYHKFCYNKLVDAGQPTGRRQRAHLIALETEAAKVHEVETILFNCNVRLVISLVRKMRLAIGRFPEALSDGTAALLHCITKYNYTKVAYNKATGHHGPVKFSTYATWGIGRALYNDASREFTTINRLVTGQDDRLQFLTDQREYKDNAIGREERRRLNEALRALGQRERRIICLRYGLGDRSPRNVDIWTLREVGSQFGISKERVRQITDDALKKLRTAMSA